MRVKETVCARLPLPKCISRDLQRGVISVVYRFVKRREICQASLCGCRESRRPKACEHCSSLPHIVSLRFVRVVTKKQRHRCVDVLQAFWRVCERRKPSTCIRTWVLRVIPLKLLKASSQNTSVQTGVVAVNGAARALSRVKIKHKMVKLQQRTNENRIFGFRSLRQYERSGAHVNAALLAWGVQYRILN